MGEQDIVAIRQWLAQNATKLNRQGDELNRLRAQIAAWATDTRAIEPDRTNRSEHNSHNHFKANDLKRARR